MQERNLSDEELREIAMALFEVEWMDATNGFIVCPGKDLHTKGDGPRDCKIQLGGGLPPTISCFHASCLNDVEVACHKLRSAIGKAKFLPSWLPEKDYQPKAPVTPPPPKPQFAQTKLAEFAARWREFVDTAWLADRSPIEPFQLTPGAFLAALYRREELQNRGERVVVFTKDKSQGQALWPETCLPETGPLGVWFLSQPVDGKSYPNPRSNDEEGKPKMSRRSEESVTAWRYLVIESDQANARDWLGALVQLPLRIAAIYTSGGKSIHALVRVDAPSKHEWDHMMRAMRPILVTLGADPKSLTAVRLTRLPGCWREGKMVDVMEGPKKTPRYVKFETPALQKLLYLNPEPGAEAICARPRLRETLATWRRWAEECVKQPLSALEGSEDDYAACVEFFRWFESSKTAREILAKLLSWHREGGKAS